MCYLLSYCVVVVVCKLLFCSFSLQKTEAGLNDSTICTSIVPIRSESYGLWVKHRSLTNMELCQTVDCICVNDPCCHWVHILQSYVYGGLGSGPPESSIFFLSNSQVILANFVNPKEVDYDICSTQVCPF